MTEQVNRLSAPVYLKHADVSMIRGNILITICNAANRVTPNNIVGAYKSRGIWQIAVKTQTARAQLLTQGISIDKHLVQLYDDNPYTHRAGETSEKIVFKGLPFEFQNYHITEFLKKFSQIEPRSNILFAREKNQDNELFSLYLNGERYIFVKGNFTPPLPKEVRINDRHCQIWHRSQKSWCLRCNSNNHGTEKTDQCDAYDANPTAVMFKSRNNVLCNYYMCEINVWGLKFPSAEHAHSWAKCTEFLKPELAEQVIKTEWPIAAKDISRQIDSPDNSEWDTKRVETMSEILYAKAQSCELFKKTLLSTNGKEIIEATEDRFWGCGLDLRLAQSTKPSYYPGTNKLGKLLQLLRDKLIVERYETRIEKNSALIARAEMSAKQHTSELTPAGLNSQPLLQGQITSSDDMNSQLSVDNNEILSLNNLAPNAASMMAQDITDFTTEYVHQHSNVKTPVNLNREKLSDVMICDSDTISPNATISSLVITPNKSSDKLQNVLKTQIPNAKRISTPKRKHQSEETLHGKKQCTPVCSPSSTPVKPVSRGATKNSNVLRADAVADDKIK